MIEFTLDCTENVQVTLVTSTDLVFSILSIFNKFFFPINLVVELTINFTLISHK